MKTAHLLLPIFLFAMTISGPAETKAVTLDPEQELFFSQFRTAIHGENVRQLISLTHPQALQCVKEDEQEYYYGLILKGLIQMLGHQQTVTEIRSTSVGVQDLQKTSETAGQSSMEWPIPPEEQLILTYEKDGSESTATIYIARAQNQWKWVHLCYQ